MSNKDTTEAIAARLRLAREQAGLSQGQVAKLFGLHRPSISEIEAGRRKVSAEELAKFAHTYDVTVDWLVGNVNEKLNLKQDRIELAAREIAKLDSADLDRLLQLLATLRLKQDTDQ